LYVTFIFSACASATSAEEYYSIGMAYYEIGKYDEAEIWLIKANSINGRMRASEYNLGRIAFETKRYSAAEKYFKNILKDDPDNVMALKAVAYTEIMLGDLEAADRYYEKVLSFEPESTDDGYNYAMVLYAMEKYPEAESVLIKFSYNMPDNKNTLLLLARTKKAQHKVEAIDDYALWLVKNSDPLVRFEYAQALEDGGYYARAIEELKKTLDEFKSDTETETFKKSNVQFNCARLILTADPNNDEGIDMLRNAVESGFRDLEAIVTLSEDSRVTKIHQEQINNIASSVITKRKAEENTNKDNAANSTDAEKNAEGKTETKTEENTTTDEKAADVQKQ
jgi:tetratricopeptide (TPR) repeat protein